MNSGRAADADNNENGDVFFLGDARYGTSTSRSNRGILRPITETLIRQVRAQRLTGAAFFALDGKNVL